MLEAILTSVKEWSSAVIQATGYPGIVLLMTLESACIPVPSEAIMTVGGVVARQGFLNFHLVSLSGALGCTVGSALAYWAGIKGGRPFLIKYGRLFLIRPHDLDVADRWFAKYGQMAVFISRMLPIIRTFISFPAGIHRMNFWPFLALSFVGSVPWCYMLTYLGYHMEARWQTIQGYLHRFEVLIAALIVMGVAWFVWAHVRPRRQVAETE